MNSYFRCIHMDETGNQCETWFKEEGNFKLCEEHRLFLRSKPEDSPKSTEERPIYIDLVNEQINICAKMNLDELEVHISNLERALETEKTKLYAARANLRQKLDDLSDSERKERLAHKLNKEIREPKSKTSAKKDPVTHLATKHGLSTQAAKDLMNMDVDALMEKYNKSKEKS
jgi:predicted RNase H-like nuclease (RuvC/YqgF family)